MSWIGKKIGNYLEKQLINRASVNNKLWEALYYYLSDNIKLERDDNASDYVKKGYEGNPDVFGIVSKIARQTARVKLIPMKGDKESEYDPLQEYFSSNLSDKTFFEHRQVWSLFGLICGESMVYYPKLKGGNNAGKLMGFNDMPPQQVEIIYGGWRQPVRSYVLKLKEDRPMTPDEVWHTRLFPNLDYTNGKNFSAISPIKVAASVISSQNAGYNLSADVLNRKIPLGILSKKEEQYQHTLAKEQKKNLEKQFQEQGNKSMPIFTLGDLSWTKLSYDTLKDLQVIETSENGLRVLCRVLSVPSQLFGDPTTSTYNNVLEMRKEMYEERIKPDVELYVQGVNKIIEPIYGIHYIPDYSDIECLQKNRFDIAKEMDIGVKNKSILRNEYREALGYDPIDAPEFDEDGTINEINNPRNELDRPREETE